MRSAALVVLGLLWCGPALACGTDPTPAPAAAFGLTCEVFVDNMTNASNYDLANTRAPGFNWYTNQNWPNAAQSSGWPTFTPTQAVDYTIDGSGLHMNPTTDSYPASMFNSCAESGSGYVGTAYSGSFYLDVTYSYSGSGSGQWPAVWSMPVEFLTAGTTNPVTFDEIDFFEAPFQRQLHQWSFSGGGGSVNETYTASLGSSPNGTLLVNPSLNSGVALLERATNDVVFDTLQFSATMAPIGQSGPTGQPVGTFASAINDHFCIFLTTGPGQPLNISRVAVWQAPHGIVPAGGGGRRGLFR